MILLKIFIITFILIGYSNSFAETGGCCYFKTLKGGVPKKALNQMLLEPCSRSAPEDVTGYWIPKKKQIRSLEVLLPSYLKAIKQDYISLNIDQYNFFYIGININNKHIIYVDAALQVLRTWPDLSKNWEPQKKMSRVCDGGNSAWGIEYEPKLKKFSGFLVNGGL